jgi:hypothetical protein
MNTATDTIDSVKNLFTNSIQNATSSMNKLSSSVKQTYDSVNGSGLYIGLIFIIVLCLFVALLLYYYITNYVFLHISKIVNETKVPVVCTEKHQYVFEYDKTENGDRRSFTFWIYIHDMNKNRGTYKNVFNVSETKSVDDISKSSPYIFLDQNDNKLYIRFKDKLTRSSPVTKHSELTQASIDGFMKTGITIPYVPLQRWVHIGVVCNANSYKNYMYAYVDGDLVNTISSNEVDKHINSSTIAKDFKNLDLNVSGYLNVGGNNNDADGPGFSGLITKITTYNYELNQKDIYNNYYKGPIDGLLYSLGLAKYGVRSPIYKL